ncbi:beta/gamma crystallin domain-containing protein [Nonomuraea turcica]|uniref:beta/gamma crystallin domain-containing protein n=1 Tax=Nonomuraea sp. G32 TaxID=3067274 RepID=UPI0035304467
MREFLIIQNGLDRHCFANGGTMSVAIYGVDLISAGNNNVEIEYIDDLGGPSRTFRLPKWNLWGAYPSSMGINGPMHMIYRIRII